MNGLQLCLRDGLKNTGADLFIRNLRVQDNLGHLPKRMDVSSQCFAMRGVVGLLGALCPPKNANNQIVKRDQKPIQQFLLEILKVTDQQRCTFLLGETKEGVPMVFRSQMASTRTRFRLS